MAFVAALITSINYGNAYTGFPPSFCLLLFLFFVGLLVTSKRSKTNIASYLLIFFFLLPTIYTLYKWGIDIPTGLLGISLAIIMSGILVSSQFSFFITSLLAVTIVTLFHFQGGVLPVESSWRTKPLEPSNVWIFIVLFAVINVVAWLSNREIERSLRRARKSEAELKKERDSLEIRVEERTKELKETQRERMVQLTKFAEFGKLASGIFHDLSNPLTAASLNLEEIGRGKKNKYEDVKPFIDRALKATKRVEEFVGSTRRQIQQQDIQKKFNIKKEISEAFEILNYKAQSARVQLRAEGANSLGLYGNPLKFVQVATNLISNAIDSYDKTVDSIERCVLVKCEGGGDYVTIFIQDWGKGIKPEFLTKIFDPFFTTKTVQHGTGIGLSIVKGIVEDDFRGKISIKSEENKGTTFTIKIPSK